MLPLNLVTYTVLVGASGSLNAALAAETIVSGTSLVPMGVLIAGLGLTASLAWKAKGAFDRFDDRLRRLEESQQKLSCLREDGCNAPFRRKP